MEKKTYHHGNLAKALLAAAEEILERDGLSGLTLRAVARAAGVSHAAPAHHFGDLTGLLSELAASGYERFRQHQLAAMEHAPADGISRFKGRGSAYVGFARAHPQLFLLMFRSDRLDWTNPTLRGAADASFQALASAAAAGAPPGSGGAAPDLAALANAMAAWSLVHGFASLMIDGRLPDTVPLDALLEAVLERLVLHS